MLLTPARIANQLRCWINYALSLFGIVHISHYPTFLTIEPSNICQLACPQCPVGMAKKHTHGGAVSRPHPIGDTTEGAGALPHPLNEEGVRGRGITNSASPFPDYPLSLLADCFRYAHTIQFYFQGEPLLNPRLPELIHEAAQQGLYTIVSTNAQSLDHEMARRLITSGLHRIIISMDGLSQASYEAYRQGGSVEKTKAAIRYLREEREIARRQRHISGDYPIIELQCLLLRSNEQEQSLMRKTYRLLGADRLTFKTAQFYDYQYGNPLMPTRDQDRRYQQCADGTYRLKRSPLRRLWQTLTGISPCYRLWAGCVLTTGGDVLPCCYDKSHTLAYGNIHTVPLATIFRSKQAKNFRRQVILAPSRQKSGLATATQPPEICQNCWH